MINIYNINIFHYKVLLVPSQPPCLSLLDGSLVFVQ
jgi:hypothetical protein